MWFQCSRSGIVAWCAIRHKSADPKKKQHNPAGFTVCEEGDVRVEDNVQSCYVEMEADQYLEIPWSFIAPDHVNVALLLVADHIVRGVAVRLREIRATGEMRRFSGKFDKAYKRDTSKGWLVQQSSSAMRTRTIDHKIFQGATTTKVLREAVGSLGVILIHDAFGREYTKVSMPTFLDEKTPFQHLRLLELGQGCQPRIFIDLPENGAYRMGTGEAKRCGGVFDGDVARTFSFVLRSRAQLEDFKFSLAGQKLPEESCKFASSAPQDHTGALEPPLLGSDGYARLWARFQEEYARLEAEVRLQTKRELDEEDAHAAGLPPPKRRAKGTAFSTPGEIIPIPVWNAAGSRSEKSIDKDIWDSQTRIPAEERPDGTSKAKAPSRHLIREILPPTLKAPQKKKKDVGTQTSVKTTEESATQTSPEPMVDTAMQTSPEMMTDNATQTSTMAMTNAAIQTLPPPSIDAATQVSLGPDEGFQVQFAGIGQGLTAVSRGLLRTRQHHEVQATHMFRIYQTMLNDPTASIATIQPLLRDLIAAHGSGSQALSVVRRDHTTTVGHLKAAKTSAGFTWEEQVIDEASAPGSLTQDQTLDPQTPGQGATGIQSSVSGTNATASGVIPTPTNVQPGASNVQPGPSNVQSGSSNIQSVAPNLQAGSSNVQQVHQPSVTTITAHRNSRKRKASGQGNRDFPFMD